MSAIAIAHVLALAFDAKAVLALAFSFQWLHALVAFPFSLVSVQASLLALSFWPSGLG